VNMITLLLSINEAITHCESSYLFYFYFGPCSYFTRVQESLLNESNSRGKCIFQIHLVNRDIIIRRDLYVVLFIHSYSCLTFIFLLSNGLSESFKNAFVVEGLSSSLKNFV
jgi:hypothetical protein